MGDITLLFQKGQRNYGVAKLRPDWIIRNF